MKAPANRRGLFGSWVPALDLEADALVGKDNPAVNDITSSSDKVNNSVTPMIRPRVDWMIEHLEFLFSRALQGKIEITGINTTSGHPKTAFFDLDDIEGAAVFAEGLNSQPGFNVYVGAATRHEDVLPGKAANDDDFDRAYALFADFDEGHDFEAARHIYEGAGLKPALVVVTGRTPTKRVQVWWPLEDAISDAEEQRCALRGIIHALHSDPAVKSAKQIMRLAGTLNWPKKDGRVLELCELHRPKNALPAVSLSHIHKAFPPITQAEHKASDITDVETKPKGALGLGEEITDGREGYAFRLCRAHLVEIIGTTGCAPTPDELYQSVWPIFASKTDQVRPGRGPTFMKQKCVEAVTAFERGAIPFARNLDEAVATYAAQQRGEKQEGDPFDEVAQFESPETERARSRPFPASKFQGEPPERQWVVKDWIVEGAVNSLYGDGGLGKTLLAQQLACAVSLGQPWLGLETKKGVVLAALCEDEENELWRRHNDIKNVMGYVVGNPFDDVLLWPRVGEENVLVRWDKDATPILSDFYRDLVDEIRESKPSLVIIDTLADVYGGNEIDRVQVNYFVKTVLGGLIKERGLAGEPLTVLLLGHPSQSGKATGSGFSGSTAWNNSVRSRLYLTRPEEGSSDERVLTRGKANYAASGEDTGLKLYFDQGVLHPQEVVQDGDTMLWAAMQEVVKQVRSCWDQGAPFNNRKGHGRYIHTAITQAMEKAGFGPQISRQAVRECVDDGKIALGKSNGKAGWKAC